MVGISTPSSSVDTSELIHNSMLFEDVAGTPLPPWLFGVDSDVLLTRLLILLL